MRGAAGCCLILLLVINIHNECTGEVSMVKMCSEFGARLNLFLSTSGEELTSAECGFVCALFDLFLESNVMIVADFEIWKHTLLR